VKNPRNQVIRIENMIKIIFFSTNNGVACFGSDIRSKKRNALDKWMKEYISNCLKYIPLAVCKQKERMLSSPKPNTIRNVITVTLLFIADL